MADNNTLESLEIEVKQRSKNAASEIDETAAALKRVQSAVTGVTKGLSGLNKKLASVSAATGAARAAAGKQASYFREQAAIQKEIEALSAKGSGLDYAEADRLIEQYTAADLLRLRISSLTEKLSEMVTSQKNNGEQVAKTTEKIQRLRKELASLSDETAKATFASKKLSGGMSGLFKTFGRAFVIRLGFQAINELTRAMREGIDNAQAFSNVTGGPLADALDNLATSTFTLKNQLGGLAAPIITAVAPALQTIITKASAAAAAIAQLFALLGGSGTYLKAKEVKQSFKEIGGGAGGAAESVKELRRQLMGFDEINRLEAPDTGGGGGGAGGANIGDMFEEVAIDSRLLQWRERLRPILDDIAQVFHGFIEVVNGIFTGNWAEIFAGAGEIVQGFGDLIRDSIPTIEFSIVDWLNDLTAKFQLTFAVFKALLKDLGGLFSALGEGRFGDAAKALKNIGSEIELLSIVFQADFATATKEAGEAVAEMNSTVSEEIGAMSEAVAGDMEQVDTAISSAVEDAQSFWESGWSGISYTATEFTKDILSAVQDWAINVKTAIASAVEAMGSAALSAPVGVLGSGTRGNNVRINGLADGGIPSTGSLFWAGEAGPELVGQIGGRTTVTNTDMFGQALDGQTNALLGAMNILNKTVQDKDTDISLDGMSLARGMYQYNKRVSAQHGKSMVEVGW